jgi:hypothetical protein
MTRALLSKMVIKGCNCRFPDIDWPYCFYAGGYPNGTMPYPWNGGTYTISGGQIINTPTGTDVCVNGDMELNSDWNSWVGGVNGQSLVQAHSPTHSWSVAGADASYDGIQQTIVGGTIGRFYSIDGWLWTVAGGLNSNLMVYPATPGNYLFSQAVSTAAWNYREMTWMCTDAVTYGGSSKTWGATATTFYTDDVRIRLLPWSSLMATVTTGSPNVAMRGAWTIDAYHQSGVVVNVNDATSPTYFVLGYYDRTTGKAVMVSCLGGVLTPLIDITTVYSANGNVEIRKNGTTYKLFYNGAQIGADQTIANAGLNNNLIHGLFSTGGSQLYNACVGSSYLYEATADWCGTSLLADQSIAIWIYDRNYLQANSSWLWTCVNHGVSGATGWLMLHQEPLFITAHTPKMLVFDFSNDDILPFYKQYEEGFVRKMRTDNPNCNMVLVVFPSITAGVVDWPEPAKNTQFKVLATAYDIPIVDAHTALYNYVLGGGLVTDYYTNPDWIHPNAAGYAWIHTLVRGDELAQAHGINQWSGAMGDYPRLYAGSADFEFAPVTILGTAYDARTGVWVDTGSSTASVTLGSTITYSGTFRSFGCYNAARVYPNVSIVIDADPPINPFGFNDYGYDYGVRAAHTVVITVLTTCTIDEFWAI